MSWINDDSSTEIMASSSAAGWEQRARRLKLERHKKEIKFFLKSLNWFEFQELMELWARHVSKKRSISFSATSEYFYKTPEWRRLRYLILAERKHCALCGWGAEAKKKLHVDHINSRWLHPERALDPENLQVLCDDCNLGKGITGETTTYCMRPSVILRKNKV